MKIAIRNVCTDFDSYRAARVKSLFNVDSGANFSLDADIDIDDGKWQIGVIVGPSGTGKTSLAHKVFGAETRVYEPGAVPWDTGKPIIDIIGAGGDFDDATAALASVGLGSVPSWLRPYSVLSNGEKFRADLARIICDAPKEIVIDEFTSVVDRQVARFGSMAFAKAWRRTGGKVVLVSCHYDIIDWITPDWVYDTRDGGFQRGRSLWRRPPFELEVVLTDWRYWKEFEPHHYLKLPKMPCAKNYVGVVEGQRVVHLAVSTIHTGRGLEARACRLVVMPEWQGAGVGLRFLDYVCQRYLDGEGHVPKPLTTLFHTSHPGLAAALRGRKTWRQTSAQLYGANKSSSSRSISKASNNSSIAAGYGGHFRAVQGFRYVGEKKAAA